MLVKVLERMRTTDPNREIWDFSQEKAQPVFVCDDRVLLRLVTAADADFYVSIRMQYSLSYRIMLSMEPHSHESLLLADLCQPESYFCIIENSARTPIGYIGLKDTSKEIWEIAIELDSQYTHQGYGSHSIKLFLNEISRITGRTVFCAKVDPDNVPSQRCFEHLGAELSGLCDGPYLKTPEEKARFEENNLNLINDDLRTLAERISVDVRRLLSHALEYRLTCPM